eukprot:364247-Chlamydomonas_euryale.AAC.19
MADLASSASTFPEGRLIVELPVQRCRRPSSGIPSAADWLLQAVAMPGWGAMVGRDYSPRTNLACKTCVYGHLCEAGIDERWNPYEKLLEYGQQQKTEVCQLFIFATTAVVAPESLRQHQQSPQWGSPPTPLPKPWSSPPDAPRPAGPVHDNRRPDTQPAQVAPHVKVAPWHPVLATYLSVPLRPDP